MANILIGQEVLSPTHEARSQGFLATHTIPAGETSWNHTSYMNRSFISFSFGGRWIDDWGLVATIDGDRMQRAGSANFEDLTSTYEVLDGQFYWGTHFNANEMSFILATDRITQEELDDFKHWFCAGRMEELVLAEHPNRGIIARIAEPLNISMLPFEEKTKVTIAGIEYDTSTTIYKGEIDIRFIMDDPFWYSKQQYFDFTTKDANNNTVNSLENKDALKIILEDGVPIREMFTAPIMIGDNKIYTNNNIIENNGLELSATNMQYLYYPGNAPVEPEVSFTITPILNESGYISSPKNSFTHDRTLAYDKIIFESVNHYELLYSLPSPYVGYNQAIKIFNTVSTDIGFVELRRILRDNITDKNARAWAIMVVDSLNGINSTELLDEDKLKQCIERMKYFLYKKDNDEILTTMTISVNSKTGQAVTQGGYRSITIEDITPEQNDRELERSLVYGDTETEGKYLVGRDEDTAESNPLSTLAHSNKMLPHNAHDFYFFGQINEDKAEEAGDMFRSAYLKLKDRNILNNNGEIATWTDINPNSSYKIWTDAENGLKNFKVNYKYMYY